MPLSGTATSTVTDSPAFAVPLVPSAKVMSWGIWPALARVTAYVPALSTESSFGSNPRSMALISSVPRTSPETGAALAAGAADPAAVGAAAATVVVSGG